jgi:hypothetical protein
MIEELKSWLPNYDHGPADYPTLLWRILASAPGGDEAADMGYEPFSLGWQEIAQLGDVLAAIQDKGDVEDLITGLLAENEDEGLEEAPRRAAGTRFEITKRRLGWTATLVDGKGRSVNVINGAPDDSEETIRQAAQRHWPGIPERRPRVHERHTGARGPRPGPHTRRRG